MLLSSFLSRETKEGKYPLWFRWSLFWICFLLKHYSMICQNSSVRTGKLVHGKVACCDRLWSSLCGHWVFHLIVFEKKNIVPWKPLGSSSVLFGLASGVLYLMIFEKKNISPWKPLGSSLVLFRFGVTCPCVCVQTCSTVFQFCTDVLGMMINWSPYLFVYLSINQSSTCLSLSSSVYLGLSIHIYLSVFFVSNYIFNINL